MKLQIEHVSTELPCNVYDRATMPRPVQKALVAISSQAFVLFDHYLIEAYQPHSDFSNEHAARCTGLSLAQVVKARGKLEAAHWFEIMEYTAKNSPVMQLVCIGYNSVAEYKPNRQQKPEFDLQGVFFHQDSSEYPE